MTSASVITPAASPSTESERTQALLGVLVAVLLFSAGSTMIKSAGVPGAVMAFWRLTLGAIGWQVYLRATHRPFSMAHFKATAVPGLLFGFNLTCFYTGVRMTAVSHAEFMGVLSPLILVPLTAIRHRERIARSVLVAGAAAIIGVLMIVAFKGNSDKAASLRGDLLILVSVFSWITYLLRSKKMRESMDPRVFVAGMSIWAIAAVAVVAVPTGKLLSSPPKAWLFFAITALLNGVIGHGLLTHAQASIPLGVITLLQLAQPPLSTLWAFVFLHERVRPLQIAGMALVIAAVAVVARGTAQQNVDAAEPFAEPAE